MQSYFLIEFSFCNLYETKGEHMKKLKNVTKEMKKDQMVLRLSEAFTKEKKKPVWS